MLDNKFIALYERLSIEDADVKRNDAKSESNSIAHQRRLLFSFIEQHPELSGFPVRELKMMDILEQTSIDLSLLN